MMPVGQRYEFPDWFQLGLQKRTYNHRGETKGGFHIGGAADG